MAAYVIVDVTINDPVNYEAYKQLAPSSIAQYGGKYLARGGHTETLEGDWTPGRLVILEFPTLDQAKAWLHSPEYAPARAMRHAYATTHLVVTEGLA